MNDELKRKLDTWKVAPAVPGGFQREVWQRIAAREAARQQSGWRQRSRRFFELLATPRYATAACLTAVVIGAGAAQVRATQENDWRWSELQTRYAISIDPVAQAVDR
jgi:hypothetical protein